MNKPQTRVMGRFRQFYEGLEMEAVGMKTVSRVNGQVADAVDQHAILSIKQRLSRELNDLTRERDESLVVYGHPAPLLMAIDQLGACIKNLDLLLAE